MFCIVRISNFNKLLKIRWAYRIYKHAKICAVTFRHRACLPLVSSLSSQKFLEIYSYYATNADKSRPLNLDSLVQYERVSEETIQSLYLKFEDLLQDSSFPDWDANYNNGVLTIVLEEKCVYVINKQTPNRQIWLSSPISGPKRYDYLDGMWIYKHNGESLHQLLTNELSDLLKYKVDFTTCSYSSSSSD